MSKAKAFNKALSNIALQNVKGQYEKNPHITMHFVVRKNLKFSTYGGLTLNYRLLLSLTASCITYLMILLQFNGSPTRQE
ncbi:Hypothetical protein NTJ_09565 [Nesidiocoris tenuis]|uniref:Gustatory receptor n=1 Tax=Nesidiocoris tenuis TaxID=355587 RepID=A0ABN7AZC6_9HEMI|nr:Hypothetical protein NTJ_09565 [Nesidiocoris tenuis]